MMCEKSVAPLTPAQVRILRYLEQSPGWRALEEIERVRFLDVDDLVVVPSLIERGYVQHTYRIKAVALTAMGADAARQIRMAKR